MHTSLAINTPTKTNATNGADDDPRAANPLAIHNYKLGRYAVIDIGTVTCRMLIADVVSRVDKATETEESLGANSPHLPQILPLAKEYKITNLGEGVDATGVLTEPAMQRVVCALEGFFAIRERFNTPEAPILSTVTFATSASRDAINANDFAQRLQALGLKPKIIPGVTEAALSFLGAGIDHASEEVVVCDIGGGSTEISIGTAGSAPAYSHSFNVGCRRVTERFFASDPPTKAQISTAKTWILEQFAEIRDYMRNLANANACIGDTSQRAPKIVAVAGTATSAVTMRDKITTYDSSLVNGVRVSLEDLNGLLDMLKSCTLEVRAQTPGLDPGRAGVIVAGMLLLQCVLETFSANEFYASDNDILEGAILSTARGEL